MKVFLKTILFFIVLKQATTLYSSLLNFTEPSNYLRMISISNNNEIFVVGGDDKKVHIYLNEGGNFTNHDTLLHSTSYVNVADITGDGLWIMSND